MHKKNTLFPVFLEEIKKLSESEVSSYCKNIFFNVTKEKILNGNFPKLLFHDLNIDNQQAQIIHFQSDNNFIEVALLKSNWDIHSSSDSITYRFFLKDLTLAAFSQSPREISDLNLPINDSNLSRQALSDTFTLLWILSLSEAEQIQWGLNEKVRFNLRNSYSSLLSEIEKSTPYESHEKSIKALLVCVPEQTQEQSDAEKIPPSTPPSTLIQGKLFKALNQSALKARTVSQEASSFGALIEKHGLVELQILYYDGRVFPIKDNETLIQYLANHRSESIDRRMLDKICKINESDSLVFKTFERNIYNLIDKYITEKREVRIVLGYSTLKERSFYFANKLNALSFGGIYRKSNLQILLLGGQGRLEVKMDDPNEFKNCMMTNQVAYDFQSKTLHYHDFHQTKNDFIRFISTNENLNSFENQLIKKNEPYIIYSHEKIYSFLKDLYSKFSKIIEIPTVKEIFTQESLKISLEVDKNSFRILNSVRAQNKEYFFSNLAHEWKAILSGANEGLLATDLNLTFDTTLSPRRLQRQYEIKFLKSTGVFFTVLFNTLDWKLKQEAMGKSKALFYEELWQKLTLLLVPKNEASRQETFNDLISTKVKKIAINYIEALLDFLDSDYESKVIGNNEIIIVPGLIKEQAKIIHYWLHEMAQVTKGDLFIKSNSNILPLPWLNKKEDGFLFSPFSFYLYNDNETKHFGPFTFYYPVKNTGSPFVMPLSSWARLPQIYPEINLKIDGHPLEAISPEQFMVNFELTQANDSSKDENENQRIDWFDLNPKYFLNGEEITEKEAKKLTYEGVLEYQGRFFVLRTKTFPGQSALEIFWNRLQQGHHNNSRTNQNSKTETVPRRHHVLELLALRRMGITFQGPKDWDSICEYYDRLSQPRGQLYLGEALNSTLKPYQLSGVQWLWDLFQLRIGGILADDMGLGKTVQALSFLQYGHEKGAIKKVLIVVPVSLTFNWIAEAQKFTPNLNISVFEPKNLDTIKANIIVCTYSLLSIHTKILEEIPYDVVIFDEAQYLKNIGTHRFKSSENIKAKFKIALTGTPIENNLAELYSLFHLVASGLLGSRQDFKKNYVKPEELSKESLEFLKAKLKPLILRRRKQDLTLELPDKIENQIYVDFSEKQKELYRNTALSWSQKVNEAINQKGATQSKIYMLTALLRLRQVCSDPAALPSVEYKEIPPKINILLDMLEEITEEGHSAIIFTQFMSTFERVKELLKKHNIQSFEMHGGTPRKERENLLKTFSLNNSEKGVVLLMTLKTGGVGLNLTKASYVFHLEPWWNPAVENQATDRVHRLGQSKNVTVYRMIMKESVEEKVEILKKRKAQLFNNLFGDDYFSLESIEDSNTDEKSGNTTISKEDFDLLVQ